MLKKILFFIKKQKLIVLLCIILLILITLRLILNKAGLPKEKKEPFPELEKETIIPETAPLASQEPKPEKQDNALTELTTDELVQKIKTDKTLSETEVMDLETEYTLRLYPLINYLPIENERYYLTYKDSLVLQVTLKKGKQEEIKKEIVDWIKSKNVDPATHKIIFK